ncbi:DUF4307 domain-containing protein [Falsarthrobacter nasiphocae]|uniref:DUF4307 domain-containing protein n=1 Tax=Falsarthrobacter nasiphocae TaxID=189863 RepID=A0AAE3YD22_9MICC|nr:DUF4307 domain-containing protein [Falsarthrobacter nasiphocae]MDR6891648.1 hypothetical protein [Falsarthrobacter nasiphocae]
MQNDSLAQRYGRPRRAFALGRVRWWIIGVLGLAVAVAAGLAIYQAGTRVTSKDVSFAFPEKGVATVDFSVTKRPSATAECAVQVLNERFAVVGWKIVRIGPNSADDPHATANGTTTNHRATLRTVQDGVNGGVHSCWAVR